MLRGRRRIVAIGLVLITFGLVAATQVFTSTHTAATTQAATTPASESLCPQTFGSFSAGHWPPACWRPYGPRSPFNTPIPQNPRLASDSRRVVSYMLSHHWAFEGSHGRLGIDAGGSRPVYWARPSDPLVRIRCRVRVSCRHVSTLRIPANAQPQDASDGHMTVVEQASGWEYDFWQAGRVRHGAMTTSAASRVRIGANAGTGLEGDAEAADLGLLGGLVRAPELAAGRIEHALAMSAPCVQLHDVWPSPAYGLGDGVCRAHGAGPHLGSLLQLDMSDSEIAASGAPAWQRTLMTAMAHYGLYVVDTGSAASGEIFLLSEDDRSYTSFGYPGQMQAYVASLGGGTIVGSAISLAKFRVISPCVPRRSC